MSNETQHRAKIDADGNLLGFYPSDVYPTAPEGCVDLTEDQYQIWASSKANDPHKYYRFVDGDLVEYTPDPEPAKVVADGQSPYG